MTFDDLARNGKAISGVAAVVMHLLFFALLVFGVSWQKRQPDSAMVVDLWSSLPAVPKAETPSPEPKPEPEPPRPEPKPLPPKPEPKAQVKPDIALKEKQEKERKLKEEKIEQDKKLKAEQARKELAEKKQREQKEAEAKRAAQEQADAQRQAAAAQAAREAKALDEYKRKIKEKITRLVVLPPNMPGNPEAQFEVVQIPGGEILSVKLKRSSGVAAYDSAVERAILKAQPLPPPPDPSRFSEVRELDLKFRPKE